MSNQSIFFLYIILIFVSVSVVYQGMAGLPEDPLHEIVRHGNFLLVRSLVVGGACLESRTDYRQTPLHCAVRSDNAEIVRYLLEQGVDVNVVDEGGNTPIMSVVAFDRSIDINILNLLLRYKADINTRNKKGESAIDLLLAAKETAKDTNSGDQTERSKAENKVRPIKISRLLERGARITRNQFESLCLSDQIIICKRAKTIEEKLNSFAKVYIPEDLLKEIFSMLYGDRKYRTELSEWCQSIKR